MNQRNKKENISTDSGQATPLDRLLKECENESDAEVKRQLLTLALSIRQDNTNLQQARTTARRDVEVTVNLLGEMVGLADQVQEESLEDGYCLMQVLEAAAVAACTLTDHMDFAIRRAAACKFTNRLSEAKIEYATTLECSRILAQLTNEASDLGGKREALIQRGWAEIRDKLEGSPDLLMPYSDDPSEEWLELVDWNLDDTSPTGLVSQTDATLRLAIHMDNWCNQLKKPISQIVGTMCKAIRQQDSTEDRLVEARTLGVVAGALMEIGYWEEAAPILSEITPMETTNDSHPMYVHAQIQAARCYLMEGSVEQCRQILDSIDTDQLITMADLIVTMQTEYARYLAVDTACRRRSGDSVDGSIDEKIGNILNQTGKMLAVDKRDRTTYLRIIYFAALTRDIAALLDLSD